MGPSAYDCLKDSLSRSTLCSCIRRRPDGNILVVRQRAWIRRVEEEVLRVNFIVDISGLVCNNLEEVGTAVPAAKRRQTPVGGHRSNGREVGIESVIHSSLQILWDSAPHENAEDLVLNGVMLTLIKREQNECVIHEVRVVKQG